MPTNYDLVNRYKNTNSKNKPLTPNTSILQQYQTPNLYNQARIQATSQMANLAHSKYDDPLANLQMNQYQGQINNANNALLAQQGIIQNRNQGMAAQGVIREQTEKYLPNQLQAMGLGQTGSSESSLIGIGNTYSRNVAALQGNADTNMAELYQNFSQNQLTSQNAMDTIRFNYLENERKKEWEAEQARLNREHQTAQATTEYERAKELYSQEKTEEAAQLQATQQIEVLGEQISSVRTKEQLDTLYNSNKDLIENNPTLKYYYDEANTQLKYRDFETRFESAENYSERIALLDEAKEDNLITEAEYNQYKANQQLVFNDTLKNYGVSNPEATTGYKPAQLAYSTNVLGAYKNKNDDHEQHINTIIDIAHAGLIKNGHVVDFNYGAGSDKYVYYDGKFYKVNKENKETTTVWTDKQILNAYKKYRNLK